jgi:hypothetical protein
MRDGIKDPLQKCFMLHLAGTAIPNKDDFAVPLQPLSKGFQ